MAQGDGFGAFSSRVSRAYIDGSLDTAITSASQWFAFPASTAKYSSLVDNFAVNDIATLFPATIGTVTWSSGQVTIQADTSYSSALGTSQFYDITSSSLYLKIAPYQAASAQTSVQLVSQAASNNNFFFGLSGTNFNVSMVINGTQTSIFNVAYNATTMAWWRVREASGVLFFDTAPDGTTWTNQFSVNASVFPFALNALSLLLFCGDFGSDPTGTTTVYTINAPLSSGVTANAGLASATGAAYNPAVNLSVSAGLASATGAAYAPANTAAASAGLASAVGAAFSLTSGIAAKTITASAAGTALGLAPGITPKPTAALAAGTASSAGIALGGITARLASAVGTASSTATALGISAGPAAATGTAYNGSAVQPRTPLNLGGSATPVDIDGGAIATTDTLGGTIGLQNFGGGATPVTIDGSITLPNYGGSCSSQANTYGGTVGVTTYDGSLVGWTMQQIALTLAENNDESVNVAITQNGSALNLTSATVNMYLKTAAGTADGSALLLSSAGGSPAITITNAGLGLCTVAIPRADLTAETNTFYRIDVVFSGLQNTAIYGNITWITL